MKNQLLIAFLFFPSIIFGQNKFSYGVNVSSIVSFVENYEASRPTSTTEEGLNGLGYSGGMTIQYDLNSQLFIRSGLLFQNTHHKTRIGGLRFPSDVTNGIKYDHSILSIGIPIEFGIKFPIKKEKINFLIGTSNTLNVILKSNSSGKIEHDQSEDQILTMVENEITASSYSLGVFTGLEFSIREKFILGFEPNIKLTHNKFVNSLFLSKSKTLFETGLRLRFRLK